jgi:hypothetical protein
MSPWPNAGFRKRAWIKVGIGVIGFALMFGLFFLIGMRFGYAPVNPFRMIPLCIPFVYFCIGIIELVSGRPYRQLAAAWMSLRGWQRGVLGTFIILVAIVVMICAVALFGVLL